MMHKAELYKKLKSGHVECLACQRRCRPLPGHSTFCGVRKNIDGDLYLSVYGKAIAVHTDPIEKKPLYHFLPGAEAFSFGTIGCNFRCSFCQNWDISQATAAVRERYKQPKEIELMIGKICGEGQNLPPEKAVEYCEANSIPVIAYTYNEPTIFAEYAADTARLAKKKGIKNVFVSNGYETQECIEYMKDWCDAINIDIKSFSEDFYKNTCGGVKLQGVLDTVKRAREAGIWVECTTLVIPDLNDSDKEFRCIAEYIAGVSADIPWHISAFYPTFKMLDRGPTPPETLERGFNIGKAAGLKYVYTGNTRELKHDDTICPKCGNVVIKRGGMICLECKIDENSFCPCGEKIAGVWK